MTITKEELLLLIKEAYSEGCGGYLDLKDEISERIVEKFIKNSEKETKVTPVEIKDVHGSSVDYIRFQGTSGATTGTILYGGPTVMSNTYQTEINWPSNSTNYIFHSTL